MSLPVFLCAASLNASTVTPAINYEEPKVLPGNIFAMSPTPTKLLFKSERTASRTGPTVQVKCDYTYPDGSLAARDRVVYEAGQLVSFEDEQLQTGEKGSAVIRPDPRKPGKRRIYFEYNAGQKGNAEKSSGSEELENDTLVDDMIGPFIAAHWETLEKGSAAKFRYIVIPRQETVGFKLVKESETTWKGKPVVRIKMTPTSIIIAQLVDPLSFIVEKHGQHRILEYIGRTTPVVKNGNKWKDLDAVSVFDWGQE